ncbi:MAG TPA: TonB family protein [Puia sp.]|jgi:protein TonB|nr:TonB family protein [Puia sp.]
MEAQKVLQSDILDILFDRRNKEYGAYQLRKGYNKRLLLSLSAIALLTASLFGVNYLSGLHRVKTQKTVYSVVDVQLESIKEENKIAPPPSPPPPPATVQKVEITKFTPPKIVKDEEVKLDERPPEQEKLQETKIGAINQEGVKDEGITGPPTGETGNKGVVEAPAASKAEDWDRTFTKVEIESDYPGGVAAWIRYLNRNFRYPDDALNNEIHGTVVVQFVVDKDGLVSDVQVVSGPATGGLREEAMRVIRHSGKWNPAIQNGRKVKSYKQQPIIFELRNS